MWKSAVESNRGGFLFLSHGRFDHLEQSIDDFVDGNTLGLRAVIDQNAMAQGRMGQGANILLGDMGASLEEGANLGAKHEKLSGAQTRAPTDPAVDEVGRILLVGPRGRGE